MSTTIAYDLVVNGNSNLSNISLGTGSINSLNFPSGQTMPAVSDGITVKSGDFGIDTLDSSGNSVVINPQIFQRTEADTEVYLLGQSEHILGVTRTTVGTSKVVLPPTSSLTGGRTYYIVDEGGNANTNNITIWATGADTILGTSSLVMNVNYMSVGVYTNGSGGWFAH